MTQRMHDLAHEIVRLQAELDREIEGRRRALGVEIAGRIVGFERGVLEAQRQLRASAARFVAESEAVQIPLHGSVEGPKNIPPLNSFKPMTLDYGKAESMKMRERERIYDTTLHGYSNAGHTFGDDLTEAERRALIEYVKTL